MRFLLSLMIWIVIVGGLWLYTWQRDMARANVVASQVRIHEVDDDYSLEITSTFSVETDPFSLQLDDSPKTPLQVLINGREIELDTEVLRRGEVLKKEKVPHLVVGSNELYLKASPPFNESNMDHGMRVRLLQAGGIVLDKTVWSRQGSLVSGTVSFQLEETAGESHGH